MCWKNKERDFLEIKLQGFIAGTSFTW